MLRSGKRGVSWGAAALSIGLLAGGQGVASAAPAPQSPPRFQGEPKSVTLVTGDRVVLDGDRVGALTKAPGREHIAFQTFEKDGRLHVVPRDALRPIAEGKLDLRLFDVTGLVEAGYDDAHRDHVPLIVTGTRSLRAASGVRVTRDLPAVGAVAARAAKAEAATAFRSLVDDPGVGRIWLDGMRQPTLDRSTAQIGAPAAWQAGFTGKGVKVAVLDTGVDEKHADLAGQQVAERNFTEDPDATDGVGHGTHVAATIASKDAKYRGVAPDAQLLDGKVCVLNGCAESWILDGMQWAADQGADVVNLSLGGGDTPEVDPLEEAVNRLSAEKGVLFVIAAGNSGGPETVGSPGSADAALTVGAVDRADKIAPFSSRGPRVGDGAVKPDITAPGVDIVAAKSSAGVIGTPVDPTHVALSGTSMATPHVAGAAALLVQQHPDWTGAQVKAALTASAKHNPDLTAFDQGAGRVDLAKAITTTVTTDPVSLGFGLQQWPHDDDKPVTKDVTYRNSGAQPVTLDLSVDARGPDGKPAPAGLFTLSATKVTVPAGGTASVSVTADTRVGTVDGAYSGAVVASGGPRTPLGVNREVESYDVSFKYTDAAGKPATDASSLVVGLSNNAFAFPQIVDGVAKLRVPKGDYFAFNEVVTDKEKVAVLPQSQLSVTGPTEVAVDARLAKPVKVTVPDPAAEEMIGDINITRVYGARRMGFGFAFLGGFGDDVSAGHLGPELSAEELKVLVGSQAKGAPQGGVPVTYRLAWASAGKVPTGFVRAPQAKDLATVRGKFGAAPAGRTFGHAGNAVVPGGGGGWAVVSDVVAPGEAIDHVTTEGVGWSWAFLQFGPEQRLEAVLSSPDRTYRKGREYEQRFLAPVYGPSISSPDGLYLARAGNDIGFGVPFWGDGYGNAGDSNTGKARTTLYREGVKVGETEYPANGLFRDVPAGKARFKVETVADRAEGVSEFSTSVSGAWTFQSDTVAGEDFKPLPLTVVRFTPSLDASGAARAGHVLRVPLVVQQQGGADNGRVTRLEVEVSFDDGKSWSKVPVVGRNALVRNADAAGFASLRVKGADSKGNTFEHSLIRAYKIKE
ncbi:S8 family peptidase [Saccharothrix variisporea]|uniref:Subtilisin family serine protease n=1 Tax=Saccharothrix variisporea TaxID=543527 RepID=A0A495X9U1_9PSEU|nr:S8 family serine peptidase [Saccharothrix variisporea]RKT69624.1 subtilisin family serine protease [Saccharothrix variisporea]